MSIGEHENPANTDFDCLQFSPFRGAGFARCLPHEVHGDVIVELKSHEGQTLADLSQWLADASIASDSLFPLILQHRLPGALRRPLSAAEIRERNLRPQAAMFMLQSQKVAIDGNGAQPVFQLGRGRLILGAADDLKMPAAIILYQPKPAKHGESVPSALQAYKPVQADSIK